MKMEAGGKYVTRGGLVVGPLNPQPHSADWLWHIVGVGSFNLDGRFNGKFDDNKDLLRLVTPGPITTDQDKWIADQWQRLLDKDDRNSPPEYPDMVLISAAEFWALLAEAVQHSNSNQS